MSYRIGRMLDGLPFGLGWFVVGGAGGFVGGVLFVLWCLIFIVGPSV